MKPYRTNCFACMLFLLFLSGCTPTISTVFDVGRMKSYSETHIPVPYKRGGGVDFEKLKESANPVSVLVVEYSESRTVFGITSETTSSQVAGVEPVRALLDLNAIEWGSNGKDWVQGTVNLVVGDKVKQFDVHFGRFGRMVFLQRDYRTWYGYAAQVGQLVAVPVDIALNIVLLAGAIVAVPIAYLVVPVFSSEK